MAKASELKKNMQPRKHQEKQLDEARTQVQRKRRFENDCYLPTMDLYNFNFVERLNNFLLILTQKLNIFLK